MTLARIRTVACLAALSLGVGGAVACSLNPQPLPPGDKPDGAVSESPGTGGGASDASGAFGDDGGALVSEGGGGDGGTNVPSDGGPPGLPDGGEDGGAADGGTDAPQDGPSDAPADGQEDGG
jgi:hypothetical protein